MTDSISPATAKEILETVRNALERLNSNHLFNPSDPAYRKMLFEQWVASIFKGPYKFRVEFRGIEYKTDQQEDLVDALLHSGQDEPVIDVSRIVERIVLKAVIVPSDKSFSELIAGKDDLGN